MTVGKKAKGVEASCKSKPRNRNEPVSKQIISAEDSSQVLLPSGVGESFDDPDVQKEMNEIPNDSPAIPPNQNNPPNTASSQVNEIQPSSAESLKNPVVPKDIEGISKDIPEIASNQKVSPETVASTLPKTQSSASSQEKEIPQSSADNDKMKESNRTVTLESTGEQGLEVDQRKLDLIDDKCKKIANYYGELSQSFENASKELDNINCSNAYHFTEWHENTKKDIRTCLEKIDESSQCQSDSGEIFTVSKKFTDDLSDSLLLKSFENFSDKCPKKGIDFKRYLRCCLKNLAYLCYQIKCSFKLFGELARAGFKDVGRLKSRITANLNYASDSLKDEDVTKFVEFGRFNLNLVVESMNAVFTEFSKDDVEIKLDE